MPREGKHRVNEPGQVSFFLPSSLHQSSSPSQLLEFPVHIVGLSIHQENITSISLSLSSDIMFVPRACLAVASQYHCCGKWKALVMSAHAQRSPCSTVLIYVWVTDAGVRTFSTSLHVDWRVLLYCIKESCEKTQCKHSVKTMQNLLWALEWVPASCESATKWKQRRQREVWRQPPRLSHRFPPLHVGETYNPGCTGSTWKSDLSWGLPGLNT